MRQRWSDPAAVEAEIARIPAHRLHDGGSGRSGEGVARQAFRLLASCMHFDNLQQTALHARPGRCARNQLAYRVLRSLSRFA
jgi:hypothetical protein